MTIYKSAMPEITLKYKKGDIQKVKISSSQDLNIVMRKMFNADTIEYSEEVIVVFLDAANKTIGWIKHSTGGMAHTIVDAKMILVTALQCGASALVLAHNHPSGQNHPSREDERMTQRVKEGCEAIGIRLLDHIIICPDDDNKYYSFCDEGKL
jgi:DNA repair protein RadC